VPQAAPLCHFPSPTIPPVPTSVQSVPVTPIATHNGTRYRLAGLVVSHSVVDFFSFIIIPILTVLEGRLSISPQQGALLIALGSVSSGLIQPVVAVLSDRYDTRWFGTLGCIAAVIAIGLTGFATEYWHLLLIQLIGAAGVGAFHPVAAAAMGQLSGPRRSLGVSIFFFAGMVGGIAGSASTPEYVKHFTLPGIAWLIIPGLLIAALLAWATHSVPHRAHGAHEAHNALPAHIRRARWNAVGLLYAGNAIRFTVNMMLVQLFIRWSERAAMDQQGVTELDAATRTVASTLGGPLQAAMQVGMGGAGLLAGMFLRARHERAALIVVPILGAAAVALVPWLDSRIGVQVVAVLAGAGFAGVLPVTISLAQRLLPHRTSLASGLMMGGAWALAAVGPPVAQWIYHHAGLDTGFYASAGLLAVSAVLSAMVRPTVFARHD
jgi:MFS family permease